MVVVKIIKCGQSVLPSQSVAVAPSKIIEKCNIQRHDGVRIILQLKLKRCVTRQIALVASKRRSAQRIPTQVQKIAAVGTLFNAMTNGHFRFFSRLSASSVVCSNPCMMSITRIAMSQRLDLGTATEDAETEVQGSSLSKNRTFAEAVTPPALVK